MPHAESVFPLGIPIAPTEPTDPNPTHIAEYGRGGLMSVADAAARDAIPSDRKTVGMLVYVQSESSYYRLSALPSTWDVLALPAAQVVTTVRNSTGVTIPKGSAVRISGATGNRPNVVLAQANTYTSAEAIGLVTQDIPNNSDGTVTEIGIVENLDTSAFSIGDILYLSPTVAGGLTNVEPSKPNWQVQIGMVTWSNPANGRILVNLRVESTKTEYITDMTATGEAVATAVDQAAARAAIGMSTAGGDLSGSYPNPAVETRGRIAYTTQYQMDGTGAGDFVTATADNATVTFTTYATMATLQGDDRSRCAIRHADSAMATVPTWELGQHAGVEVEASVRVIAFDTANNHQCGVGIWRFHTCPSNLDTIGAETLVGFYPKNGTWWVGVYVTAGVSCGNAGTVNHDTGVSVTVDRLLRVVAFPGQAGGLFYIDGVPVYRYSGAIHDPDNTVAYLGAWLQDRTGTSPAGAEVRVNSMVARHTMARNDPRLSDARTPLPHTHGNITNAGAIGSTNGLPIKTGTGGVLEAGSFGTTAGTFCEGNDARLALQTITLTGDVTGSGTGSFAATIASDAVTFAKLQNLNTDTLVGRDAAGSGDATEITVGGGIEFTGSNALRTTAFTGDVTKTAGGTALTIANDAVTYAKMQNVSATDRLLGRSSAGSGDVEEITCTAAGRAILDDADAAAQRTTLGVPTIYSGTTPPDNLTGNDGDLYFEY